MAPHILIVHYSRNGHTARLADALAAELLARGATVTRECVRPLREAPKWWLPVPLLPLLPLLPMYLAWAPFRRWWHGVYFQPTQAIQPLVHADVSGFDQVLVGTPKWLYIAYPVARWLREVRGLHGKPVAAFATFCGPPLQVFELDMLFLPLRAAIRRAGAVPGPELAVSSDFHPYFVFNEMRALFRWLSRRVFQRPLQDFTQDGVLGRQAITRFCDEVIAMTPAGP